MASEKATENHPEDYPENYPKDYPENYPEDCPDNIGTIVFATTRQNCDRLSQFYPEAMLFKVVIRKFRITTQPNS